MSRQNELPTFDYAQRLPGGFQFPARMTVLPLSNGRLALVSPIPIDDALARRIDALGEVAFLLAPNLLHHLYLGDAARRYPNARVLAPARLREKRPDLRIDAELEGGLEPELASVIEMVKFDGVPLMDEFVFCHRPSRSLVVTDLVFNITAPRGFLAHVILFLMGCHGKLAQSRAVRFSVKDKAAASASAERILALGFDTLVVAHGEIVHHDAAPALERALHNLLPQRIALPAAR